jgi:hypothetical protein
MPKFTNEDVMIVECIEPLDITGSAKDGNYVSLKNAGHVTIVINTGAWAGGTSAVTINQATAVAGTSEKALGFSVMYTNDGAATASALTSTTVGSNTFNLDTANSMYVIEIPADTLDADNDFDCIQLALASPGSNADLVSATYVLSYTSHLGDTAALSD